MTGAMEGSYAQFLGFWAAINAALESRGLPEAKVDEASQLFRLAQDETARVTFRHLRRAFCARCRHEEAPPEVMP